MQKLNLTSSMIGTSYPFYLGNQTGLESYYVYAINSPALSPNYLPYLSLTKLSERTKQGELTGQGMDLVTVCLGVGRKEADKQAKEFVEGLIRRDKPTVVSNGREFPMVEMQAGNNIQKALIIGLRDALRWKTYKFSPGKLVDLLISPTEFAVYRFEEEGEDEISLRTCVGVFSINDPNQSKPLNKKAPSIQGKWKKTEYSEINKALKRFEWSSIDRQ